MLPLGLFYKLSQFYILLKNRRPCGYLGEQLAGAHSDIGRGADQAQVDGRSAGG